MHIEGEPYQRGYQYGYLIGEEMTEYIHKLAIEANEMDPEQGWKDARFIADAFMLRKYEKEFLTEMQGIADGANKSGAELFDRKLDLIDVVTMNSIVDIEWARYAMVNTAHPLSGQNFLKSEDELDIPRRLHKCSSFLANRSATSDRRIVFGQIFMWGGYTGPHWNVICDVVPASGHRLVYQTFPGGIHSGADFYINSSGIMIGETTVEQTPFNPDGSPQSNRIRKAAQYASSIDEVVKILTTDNNGMYANDWLIADTKTDEIAVLLLGTYRHKLWRSSKKEFYGDTRDFYWCNNNPKDPEVRKEYVPDPDNAPYDLIFSPWNRDLAFNRFYREQAGKIDATVAVKALASSPINRPHACDGKVTTSDMAEKMVFLAHSGKVTLREKFVGENRRIPDLPGAVPRLSLGYTVFSPVFITEKLQAWKKTSVEDKGKSIKKEFMDDITEKYSFDKRKLWFNTVYPASAAENWFISGTAAYWKILKELPDEGRDVPSHFQHRLTELNCRYLYTVGREGTLIPARTRQVYDRYNHYQIPRIKGTYLLHQLRLRLGNEPFARVMQAVHEAFREKEMTTAAFIQTAEKVSGKTLSPFIQQWINRDDLPDPQIGIRVVENQNNFQIFLKISQPVTEYHFFTSIKIETEQEILWRSIEIKTAQDTFSVITPHKPLTLIFNALNDVPLSGTNYYTWSNYFDDFHQTVIVYGTRRQIEAQHTLAMRFSTVLADRYTEKLTPIIKDCEITGEELKSHDLIVLGNGEDNSLSKLLTEKLDLPAGKNFFSWEDSIFTRSDEGFFAAFPNPFNPERSVYFFNSNSALQLYQMTRDRNVMPSWAIFREDKVVKTGYHLGTSWVFPL